MDRTDDDERLKKRRRCQVQHGIARRERETGILSEVNFYVVLCTLRMSGEKNKANEWWDRRACL